MLQYIKTWLVFNHTSKHQFTTNLPHMTWMEPVKYLSNESQAQTRSEFIGQGRCVQKGHAHNVIVRKLSHSYDVK